MPAGGLPLIALIWTLLAFGIAVRLVYHVVFVGGCGQTPGAMALGIAVVSRAGAVPGYGRAFARWFGSVVSAVTLGLASLPFIFSRDRRGLPDRLAGTVIVRSERSGSAQRAEGERSVYGNVVETTAHQAVTESPPTKQ